MEWDEVLVHAWGIVVVFLVLMQRWAHGDALEPLVFMDTSVMLFVFSVLGFQSTFGGD